VTPDRIEALAPGDRMTVMIDGRTRQRGGVAEVFERPADRDAARCVGGDTVLAGRVIGSADGLVTIEAHGLRLSAVDRGPPAASGPCSGRRTSSWSAAAAPEAAPGTTSPPGSRPCRRRDRS